MTSRKKSCSAFCFVWVFILLNTCTPAMAMPCPFPCRAMTLAYVHKYWCWCCPDRYYNVLEIGGVPVPARSSQSGNYSLLPWSATRHRRTRKKGAILLRLDRLTRRNTRQIAIGIRLWCRFVNKAVRCGFLSDPRACVDDAFMICTQQRPFVCPAPAKLGCLRPKAHSTSVAGQFSAWWRRWSWHRHDGIEMILKTWVSWTEKKIVVLIRVNWWL